MRPGQLTPENRAAQGFNSRGTLCFNEAGAINPGKPARAGSRPGARCPASMRPGQLTPENVIGRDRDGERVRKASMRPGQLTPENAVVWGWP